MKDFIRDFEETVERAASELLLMSDEESTRPRAEGKWSAKEIIGHLIDSAANNHARFVRAQLSTDLTFQGYQQEEWVKIQRYNEEPWQRLVELWRNYNLHLAHVMATASSEVLKKERVKHNLDQIAWKTVATSETTTLEYFMRDYVAHSKNHLRQVLGN